MKPDMLGPTHKLLRKMPSLRRLVDEEVADAYLEARARAAAETKRPKSSFPDACPFTADQILDPDFYPDSV
jgi:hypothetical protein